MTTSAKKMEESEADVFNVGDIVTHTTLGYRGVIVQRESSFTLGNNVITLYPPEDSQPCYHILVEGSDNVTYANQDNLLLDSSNQPVDHPMISLYFDFFENGKYSRTLH